MHSSPYNRYGSCSKSFPNAAEADAQPDYIYKIFNDNVVNEINIEMDENDFEWLLENATLEEYRSCNITINGETFIMWVSGQREIPVFHRLREVIRSVLVSS